MTTTSIHRNYKLSRTELINSLYDIGFDDIEVITIAENIIHDVNASLPGSLTWLPDVSEIWSNTDDETDISMDEFNDILNNAIEAYMQ